MNTIRRIIVSAVVATSTLVVSVAGTASPVGAAGCPAEYMAYSTLELRVAGWKDGWDATGAVVASDEAGHRLVISYLDEAGRRSRLAMAQFDRSGRMRSIGWVGGTGEDAARPILRASFDSLGRLVVVRGGSPMEVSRYRRDGSADTSFGSQGVARIEIPGSPLQLIRDVLVLPVGNRVVVLALHLGTAYEVADQGHAVRGPFENPASVQLRESDGRSPIVATENGQLLYAVRNGIRRVRIDGTPVRWWAEDGFRWTMDMATTSYPWLYNDDKGVLTFLRDGGRDGSLLTRVPADGGPALERVIIPGRASSMAEFSDGSLVGLYGSSALIVANSRTAQFIFAAPDATPVLLSPVDAHTAGFTWIEEPGESNESVVARFVYEAPNVTRGGPGSLTGQVSRLLGAYSSTSPSDTEIASWRHRRALGTSLAEMSATLAEGSYYRDRYASLGTPDFVVRLYQDLFGHAPTWEERVRLGSLIGGGFTRSDLIVALTESPEYASATGTKPAYFYPSEGKIRRLYRAYFRRGADHRGLCYWMAEIEYGATAKTVSDVFAVSEEFNLTYGSLNDADFVELVYSNVMERHSDPEGHAYWVDQLRRGLSRGMMMLYFSESAEFILRTDMAP